MKKKLTFLLSLILILVSYFLHAQENEINGKRTPVIDSLQKFLKVSKDDTTQVNTLNDLCKQFTSIGGYENALQYAEQALQAAKKLSYQKGMASSYHNMGIIYWYKENFEKALNNYQEGLKIRKKIGDKKGISGSYNNIGSIYEKQGDYEKALENHLKSLKISEEIGYNQGISSSHNNIGSIYFYQGNFEKALFNYLKSLKIMEEIGDKHGIAVSCNNIGSVYLSMGNYNKALENQLRSLKFKEEIGDKPGIASSYNNIGNIYEKQENYEKAIENHLKGLEIHEEIGFKNAMAASYGNIGGIYMKQGKFEKSFSYLSKSLVIFKELGYKEGIKEDYAALSELFVKKGDYKRAFDFHKLFSEIKDTLLNEQSGKQIAEMSTKYDSEKKDKELIKKDAEINKQVAETEKQNLQRNAFIIGFFLVLVLAFFIFRGYRQKQNSNKLLEEKNILIEKQKQLVEEKNLKITDSINYARRIQQAILPSQELIKSFLPDSFIFFRPKDIVSGDFYWFSEKKDKLIIAVADCTGHGVPGAFMSMIGNTLLNEIVNVKNICTPDEILVHLNKSIVGLLHQSNTESSTQDDGMDITIIAIDKANHEIIFAGANHFSYLFNQLQCETIKGDVFSIGGMFGKEELNFTSQKIKVRAGSIVYLFTDGFIDQFGGLKNTKYLSVRLMQLLQNIQQYNMELQKENLIAAFDEWKGNNKQLDDVTIIGIRF